MRRRRSSREHPQEADFQEEAEPRDLARAEAKLIKEDAAKAIGDAIGDIEQWIENARDEADGVKKWCVWYIKAAVDDARDGDTRRHGGPVIRRKLQV